MKREHILFVVNPISGGRRGRFKADILEKHLDTERFSYEVYETQAAGDGYRQVKSRVEEFDGFIAVGGDGTINEVFRAIIDTDKWFSVIPAGSGNGLARTLDIPMTMTNAVKHLNKAKPQEIDYALINDVPFVNVAGIGFDAKVANKFKNSKKRGLLSYAEITLNEFKKIKPKRVKISFDNEKVSRRVLLASFANSSQFGNNFHIAPRASLNDGKLHIITLKKFHWFSAPYITWLLFSKTLDQSKLYQEYVVENATITTRKKIHLHVDGEAQGKVKKIDLRIVPKGVKVMA